MIEVAAEVKKTWASMCGIWLQEDEFYSGFGFFDKRHIFRKQPKSIDRLLSTGVPLIDIDQDSRFGKVLDNSSLPFGFELIICSPKNSGCSSIDYELYGVRYDGNAKFESGMMEFGQEPLMPPAYQPNVGPRTLTMSDVPGLISARKQAVTFLKLAFPYAYGHYRRYPEIGGVSYPID